MLLIWLHKLRGDLTHVHSSWLEALFHHIYPLLIRLFLADENQLER